MDDSDIRDNYHTIVDHNELQVLVDAIGKLLCHDGYITVREVVVQKYRIGDHDTFRNMIEEWDLRMTPGPGKTVVLTY
jgi:hypothetical protein